MTYFFWVLPTLVIALAVASGRLNTTYAAALGLITAIPVAFMAGPSHFGGVELVHATSRGLWIGLNIAPYIVGGLMFWQIAMKSPQPSTGAQRISPPGIGDQMDSAIAKRRHLFFACFLVGPFAESATGFGVGMLGTVILLRPFNLAPRHLMVFALLSQTLIPWGAMGSGTILAAAYARMPAAQLATYSMIPVALLMLVWLPLFWRTATKAGVSAKPAELLSEAAWVASGLALLVVSTIYSGLETAGLAVYGPLIVLRYLLDKKPSVAEFLATARRVSPYIAIIGVLLTIRMAPSAKATLGAALIFAPYPDLPVLSPLVHAGAWLIAGALVTSLLQRTTATLPSELATVWRTGKHAVCTIFLFAMMAEVLSAAGIAQAFAQTMFGALSIGAVFLTPVISGFFGILTNSGNAPNSLFMPSQLSLAVQAGLSIPAVAALQHVSGTSLGFFSPVRMSIAAGLANGAGQERTVYRYLMWPALSAFAILLATAGWLVL